MMRELPGAPYQLEAALTYALAPAIGKDKAIAVRVFARYSIHTDKIDLLVEFAGRFYHFDYEDTGNQSEYLTSVCNMVERILSDIK